MKSKYPALVRAIKIVGTQSKLSKCINSSQQNISYWLRSGKVAADKVILIEQATGVSRSDLRPDIYPPDQAV